MRTLQNMLRSTDATIASIYLSFFAERNALMSFLFHSLFRSENEIGQNLIDPLGRTTTAMFREFIEYYLEHGYKFITPADLANGMNADGKYAMITFDDGYYNNTLALPILEEYGVPAAFYICSDNVRDNRCFWWDVLYRELSAQGAAPGVIYRDGLGQKSLRTREIENRLTARFGENAFAPRSDIDRPLTPSELRDFAASPWVHIGNHSAGHAILTNYTREEIRDQIQAAQIALQEMTGKAPISIAYPNGGYNDDVIHVCRELGLKVGVTTRPKKTALPIEADAPQLLTLERFSLHGRSPVTTQCRTYRSDLQIYGTVRDGYESLRRK